MPPVTTHATDEHAGYRSPLEARNASREMRAAWSARRKFGTWRRIWLALAGLLSRIAGAIKAVLFLGGIIAPSLMLVAAAIWRLVRPYLLLLGLGF